MLNMPSRLSNKLKGMIFTDRTSVRPGTTPKAKDEAHDELISDGAGPSSDVTDATKPHAERNGKGVNKQPRQQQLLKEHRKEHNSSQQVHVWKPGSEVIEQNAEPVRHFMESCSNTPLRKIRGGGGGGGVCGGGRDFDENDDLRILLNVGGIRHETHATTLSHIPNSRLSRLAEQHLNSGCGKQEYFFDRHPAVFNSIIDFYRTGELHVPLEVCGAVVKRELDFWQIDELGIKACCWRHYRSYIENQRILDSFKHSLDNEQMNVDMSGLKGWKLWQTRIWLIMDHPRTSKMALAYGIISFLFVAISIAGFCLETLPKLRPKTFKNNTVTCDGEEKTISVVMSSHEALNVLDFICTVFFTLELVVRFIVSPVKLKFVLNLMNIIDLLALVPLYVQVIFEQSNLQACYMNERFVIEIMFILRIFRMFRIFHLVKHYQALKVLVYALRASLQELLMLFIFLLIAMLIFATMIYYAERSDEENTQFQTIPIGFWWAIITMTTVGYGDVAPSTPVGYIVGIACAVVGVLLVALTFPVISNNFTLFYTHVRSRSKSPKVKEEEESMCEDDDDYFRDQPPYYGSMSLKMVPSESSPPALMNGKSRRASSARDLGATTRRASGQFVPLAKFSDASSMNDIVFQEPTHELDSVTFIHAKSKSDTGILFRKENSS